MLLSPFIPSPRQSPSVLWIYLTHYTQRNTEYVAYFSDPAFNPIFTLRCRLEWVKPWSHHLAIGLSGLYFFINPVISLLTHLLQIPLGSFVWLWRCQQIRSGRS